MTSPRSPSVGRVIPDREFGRAAPLAPCRPVPRPPVLSHRRTRTQSQDRLGHTPRERGPTYLDQSAFRLQGPSPGRPPGSSFAAAPDALMPLRSASYLASSARPLSVPPSSSLKHTLEDHAPPANVCNLSRRMSTPATCRTSLTVGTGLTVPLVLHFHPSGDTGVKSRPFGQ